VAKKTKTPLTIEQIDGMIHTIRGVRVMLDRDLAKIYGVPTFRFNEAIKRNRHRFPGDFAFQLTAKEFASLRSQVAITIPQAAGSREDTTNSSQIAMSSKGRRGATYRPWAFTEHGALQAANVLRSPRAVRMSVFVIRAFVKMRETLLGTRELAKKLAALEKKLTSRLDAHEVAIVEVLQELMHILNPSPPPPSPPKPRIGFNP
jgi:ORF6N domain